MVLWHSAIPATSHRTSAPSQTKMLSPSNTNSPSPAPGTPHSTFCLCALDYSAYLVSGVIQGLSFCHWLNLLSVQPRSDWPEEGGCPSTGVVGSCNEQRALTREACLGPAPTHQLLQVHQQTLTGLSHTDYAGVFNTMSPSRGCILRAACGSGERHVEGPSMLERV